MAEQYGQLEKQLLRQKKIIAGVDEVGRGALAGPVYAGAAILDFAKLLAMKKADRILIRDSKSLSRAQREKAKSLVETIAISYATGCAETDEIAELGITKSTFLAMHRALAKLSIPFDVLLIDGKYPLPDYASEQISIICGDGSCYSIAAASILAKETRDSLMREHAILYPAYGFDAHVGYATSKHLQAIQEQGVCALHRKNFEPIKSLLNSSSRTQ